LHRADDEASVTCCHYLSFLPTKARQQECARLFTTKSKAARETLNFMGDSAARISKASPNFCFYSKERSLKSCSPAQGEDAPIRFFQMPGAGVLRLGQLF
jgi:hypothetical protein